jgi:hypothetical protein
MEADPETVEFARCFLRLVNLPNFALDRLSRYEATLCRQAFEFCLLFMRWTVKSLRSDGGAFLGWHRNF